MKEEKDACDQGTPFLSLPSSSISFSSSFILSPTSSFFSFFGRLINYANTDHADESSMRGRVRGEESDASKCEFTCCCHDRKKNDGIASEKYQNDSFFSSACYCITFDWKLSGST